jgi:hemin uptake protein HemP
MNVITRPIEAVTPSTQHSVTAAVAEPLRVVSSEALLQGQVCVHIEHAGATYTLRATRSGKLILTK